MSQSNQTDGATPRQIAFVKPKEGSTHYYVLKHCAREIENSGISVGAKLKGTFKNGVMTIEVIEQ